MITFVDLQTLSLRTCTACLEAKPTSEYYKKKDGLQPVCKECRKADQTARRRRDPAAHKANMERWKANNPEAYALYRKRARLKRYGITPEQYDQLLTEQGGKCTICGANECVTGREFAVDHCHTTGKIRGILCGPCNVGIGMLGEDLSRIEKAHSYLQSHLSNEEVQAVS